MQASLSTKVTDRAAPVTQSLEASQAAALAFPDEPLAAFCALPQTCAGEGVRATQRAHAPATLECKNLSVVVGWSGGWLVHRRAARKKALPQANGDSRLPIATLRTC